METNPHDSAIMFTSSTATIQNEFVSQATAISLILGLVLLVPVFALYCFGNALHCVVIALTPASPESASLS